MRVRYLFAAVLLCVMISPILKARDWTDSTGKFTQEAALVDYDDETAILKKPDGKLVSIPIDYLSKEDQKYLETEEAKKVHEDYPTPYREWRLRDGREFEGEVIDYARSNVEFERKFGKVFINDKEFDKMNVPQQFIILQSVSQEAQKSIENAYALSEWLAAKGGKTSFFVEGVVMELQNGEQFSVPFFMFSSADQNVLRPGWKDWVATADKKEESVQDSMSRSQASLYLRARTRLDDEERKLNMMANTIRIQDGFGIRRWRVNMMPKPGANVPIIQIVAPGQNSYDAMAWAAQHYPMYTPGGVSRINDYNY